MNNMMFLSLRGVAVSFITLFFVSISQAQSTCDICGMTIPEKAANHIILRTDSANVKPMNICSFGCLNKAHKHNPNFTHSEVRDFNQRDKMISGDDAFILVKSKNLKADLGDMVMPPYFAAFSSKEKAEQAQKKYGDGVVVKGLDNAAK